MPTPPKVKLDLTADEVVVRRLERQPVAHPFSDVGAGGATDHVAAVLDAKCAHVDIKPPTLETILDSPFRNEIEAEWSNMLGHQLPFLPRFEDFWSQLENVFAWLTGVQPVAVLPELAPTEPVTDWRPARHMTTWRTGSPMELIRFAGANRLRITIDYVAKEGRRGPRTVEPYSLRRSRRGDLLLFVVNDRRQLRAYRVDRIRGVSIERTTFEPRYRVEF